MSGVGSMVTTYTKQQARKNTRNMMKMLGKKCKGCTKTEISLENMHEKNVQKVYISSVSLRKPSKECFFEAAFG